LKKQSNPTSTKLPTIIDDKAKSVSSTKGSTMQFEKPKKRVGNNHNPTPTKLPANMGTKAVTST
jgi:hypothetical protein